MAKTEKQFQARQLRKNGKSIKFIAKKLNVSVGSVSNWCKDVVLSPKQIAVLERQGNDPSYGRRLAYSLEQKRKRIEKTKRLINEGIREVGKLSQRELFVAGIALYWGEGFKKDKQAGLANLDPNVMKFFLKWLKECFGYKNEDLIVRITLNISHKGRIEEITNYWSKLTGVPIQNFRKPFYQNTVWKKTYENPNEYYGVLRVKVRKSTDFLRKVTGFIHGLRLGANIR
jgi:transcriptional regulator with XRE-family HTH domain